MDGHTCAYKELYVVRKSSVHLVWPLFSKEGGALRSTEVVVLVYKMHTHNREGAVPIVVSNRDAEQGRFHFNKIQYCNYYLYFDVDKCPLTSGPQIQ